MLVSLVSGWAAPVLVGELVRLEPISPGHEDGLWEASRDPRTWSAALPAQFEGIHRKHMLVRGGVRRDSAWYSVLDEERPAVRANLLRRLGR